MKKYVVEFQNSLMGSPFWGTYIIRDTLEEAEVSLKKAKSSLQNLIWRINHKDPSVKSTYSDIPTSYSRGRRPQPGFGVTGSGEWITFDEYRPLPPINITNWDVNVSFEPSVRTATLIPSEVE